MLTLLRLPPFRFGRLWALELLISGSATPWPSRPSPLGKKRRPGCRPDQGRAPARATPRFLACDGQPLLIAAWLVGFMRTREPRKGQAMKTDIYQRITDQIVGELEKGVRPWLRPWNAEHAAGRITRPLRGSGIPYQGINVLMLWSAAMEKGYAAPVWMTFKQARALKANVRTGEHGSLVVYADKIIRTEADATTGEEAERAIPFLKGYTVFNVEQIDGLPEHYYGKPEPRIDSIARIDRAEAFFADTGATIRHGGAVAYYNVLQDFVQMPPFEAFRDAESFYSTLAHETVHYADPRIMPRRCSFPRAGVQIRRDLSA
jgi:antirestriction protein ArdC